MPALGTIVSNRDLSILQANPSLLEQVIIHLIKDIAQDTTQRLGDRAPDLLCPHCLTRFRAHTLKLSWLNAITFFGCRLCRQSNEFRQGRVLAVLDRQMKAPHSEGNDIIRINWLTYRVPFDFEGVYIGQASDEAVERFAVQVGNDTDPRRRTRYSKIPCTLSPQARLSENTLRILERTFGEVISSQNSR